MEYDHRAEWNANNVQALRESPSPDPEELVPRMLAKMAADVQEAERRRLMEKLEADAAEQAREVDAEVEAAVRAQVESEVAIGRQNLREYLADTEASPIVRKAMESTYANTHDRAYVETEVRRRLRDIEEREATKE
jgi:hypothetical protein